MYNVTISSSLNVQSLWGTELNVLDGNIMMSGFINYIINLELTNG